LKDGTVLALSLREKDLDSFEAGSYSADGMEMASWSSSDVQ